MKKITYYLCILTCVSFASCKKNSPQSNDSHFSDKIETGSIQFETKKENTETTDTLTFNWETDMCSCTGYFLASNYTENEIKSTFDLWMTSSVGFTSVTSVFRPQDINKIDIPALTHEYKKLIEFYDNCKPVDAAYWKEFIPKQKERISKLYYLNKLNLEAYLDPAVLLNSKYAYDDCDKYVKALTAENKELLLNTWEEWAKKSSKTNGKKNYMDEFYEKYHSANYQAYARIDLITFGWWNCVNHHLEYADYAEMQQEFDKLFFKIETDCEEP